MAENATVAEDLSFVTAAIESAPYLESCRLAADRDCSRRHLFLLIAGCDLQSS